MGKTIHYMRSDGRHHFAEPTTRPVIDRIATRTARTTYRGEGLTLGAWVEGRGKSLPWHSPTVPIAGQVWCAADNRTNGPNVWWVATDHGYFLAHESRLEVIGQAGDVDVPMFEASA